MLRVTPSIALGSAAIQPSTCVILIDTLQQIELFPVAHGVTCLLQAHQLKTWKHVAA